ncbi:MAG: hypothetical protein Kow0062_09550 [Acidobacteriota bacterium]
MSGPRFVPLTCPTCGGNLLGRAPDVVACCPPCGSAWRVDGPAPVPLRVLAVAGDLHDFGGQPLALPFWATSRAAVPAFESARPLSLARAATGCLARWSARPGLGTPPPLGVRLAPATAARLARLADLPWDDDGEPALLSVPARLAGARLHVAGLDLPCFAEDVSELGAILSRLESARRS